MCTGLVYYSSWQSQLLSRCTGICMRSQSIHHCSGWPPYHCTVIWIIKLAFTVLICARSCRAGSDAGLAGCPDVAAEVTADHAHDVSFEHTGQHDACGDIGQVSSQQTSNGITIQANGTTTTCPLLQETLEWSWQSKVRSAWPLDQVCKLGCLNGRSR